MICDPRSTFPKGNKLIDDKTSSPSLYNDISDGDGVPCAWQDISAWLLTHLLISDGLTIKWTASKKGKYLVLWFLYRRKQNDFSHT